MKVNKRNFMIGVFTTIISIFAIILCYILYNDVERGLINNLQNAKILLSWLGIIVFFLIIYSWYKITKQLLCPYTIFMLFFMLFNYGQCILWAFGIHTPNDLDVRMLYNVGYTTNDIIIKTQIIVIACLISFNLGAIFCYKHKNRAIKINDKISSNKLMYKINKLMSFVIIPATFMKAFIDFFISKSYGYSALYYGDYANSGNSIIILIGKMFVPCIVGLLLGSDFDKKVRIKVYSIYALYTIVLLLSGDRGGWIYGLVILLWLHHIKVKKFKLKEIVIGIIIIFFALDIIYAIVNIRNEGINFQNIIRELEETENPIILTITEMGSSMGVETVLVHNNYPKYPYGNTYLFSILGFVTERVIDFMDIEYIGLSTWFSQIYLDINYGAGFTIIGEALLNYGPYVAPFILIILGYIITSTIYINKNDLENNPKQVLFAVAALLSWLPITRGTMQYSLKTFFYTVIIYFGIYILTSQILYKKEKRSRK